ncbi:MAG: hypothetical protein COW21_03675, partial [Candidatus Aenigmarchaeota archaeon CG15_BIG_FIL_POST_REV_8_21_14_020_37_27]
MNLIVNSKEEFKIELIEGEILSTNGRVKMMGMEIPPYPKLLHLSTLNKKMIAQKKINGYNVRLTYLPKLNNFIAVLRGGYVCAKTTFMLRKHFSDLFMNFFKENQRKILCMEVLGKKSLANLHTDYYKEQYGFEDVGYFIFDIMDMEKPEDERFIPFERVEKICKKYNLQLIPTIGVFDGMEDLNKKLQEIPSVFEGAVVKSLDGREIMKYRFDSRPEIFINKIPTREKRQKPPEEIVVTHFFQGYEEAELGLDSGITQEEMDKYQQMLDEMGKVIAKNKSKISEQSDKIVAFLMKSINEHGTFEEDMLKEIEKLFKQKIGYQVGRFLRMKDRQFL